MGDPKFPRRSFDTPSHPWQGERIKEEAILVKQYGLKSKKELWKAKTILRNLRKLVRPTERAALSPADQERLVLGVMSEIETFGQDAESNRAFKIELLWMMRDACPTPRLLGELFLSELLRADLLVKPDFWMYPRSGRAEMTLPRLEPRHPRS